ncbi:hypothetical protein [Nonomuraea sp. NPDC002799]
MPAPTPANWNVGENPTATILNLRIRDTINFLKARPHAVMRRLSAQSIPHNTHTAIAWTAEDIDSDFGHSTLTQPERYTAVSEGIYHLTATVIFGGNATGRRDAYFRLNGDTTRRWGQTVGFPAQAGASPDIGLIIATHMKLAVGDYVEVIAYQNSGGALNVVSSNADCRFELLWVSTF